VAKLAATVKAKRYVQSHLIETPINDILRQSRGHQVQPFDGLTEIWWDSVEAFMDGNGSPEGLKAGAKFVRDEKNFVDHANSVSFITVENTVFDRTAE
jgi:EthD domain